MLESKRGRRSRSLSLENASKKRRHRSGSTASWRSYYSNESYGSRKEHEKKNNKDQVSKWRKSDLDQLNIFFNDEACSLEEFVMRVKKRACRKRKGVFKCPADIPDLMKDLVQYTKDAVKFTYDEELEEEGGRQEAYSAFNEICQNLKELKKYTQKLLDQNKELDRENKMLLTSWCISTDSFLKRFKLFLSTKLRDERESEWKGQFVDLLMSFTRIFSMIPEPGDCRKRELEIHEIRVSSIPDLHYIVDTSTPKVFYTLLVLCAEVKQKVIDISRLVEGSFKANEMIDSNVLGQHGGELLLEKTYSAFEPKVLGMICHRSKIIFTYMDMKSSQYKNIVQLGDVSDPEERCLIYYTKPYDFLIKKDRDEILEYLFWVGNAQTTDSDQFEDN